LEIPSQIFFFHTPKSAGWTLSAHIRRAIGQRKAGRRVMLHDHTNFDKNRQECLDEALKARFVHGHFSWATAKGLERAATPYRFTVLRHPRERLRSLFFFMQNLPEGEIQKSYDFVKEMSPKDFLLTTDSRLRFQIDNYMTRQFQGDLNDRPGDQISGDEMVDRAIENLRQMNKVGFVDTYDQDFIHITNEIGLPLEGGEVPKENVTDVPTSDRDQLQARKAGVLRCARSRCPGSRQLGQTTLRPRHEAFSVDASTQRRAGI